MLDILSAFFCRLPERWAYRMARVAGWLWFYLLPLRRATAARNLELALGETLSPRERREILRRCFVQWSLFGLELLRMPLMDEAYSETHIDRENWHHLEEALAQGRGVVAVTAHQGNFDVAATSQSARGVTINALYKEVRWAHARRFLWRERERVGVKIILPKRSQRDILRALRAGGIVAFVVDQHMPPHRGVVTEFFGRLVSTTPAPALFALKTGAVVVPLYMRREGETARQTMVMGAPIPMEEPYADRKENLRHNTQRINDWLEGVIREHPEQWLWLHRRFKVENNAEAYDVPTDALARWRRRQSVG